MKKFILSVFVAALVILLFAQCSKNRTTYNAHFWTNKPPSEARLFLFIDDKYKGELPYFINQPACGNEQTLSFPLESGKHKIIAKDARMNIKSSGSIKIKSNSSMSSSGGIGGQDFFLNDNCLIVKIYY